MINKNKQRWWRPATTGGRKKGSKEFDAAAYSTREEDLEAARVFTRDRRIFWLVFNFSDYSGSSTGIKMPKVKAEKKSRQHQEVKNQGIFPQRSI